MILGLDRAVEIIGCHAEGEVGDVIVSGIEPPPGDTLWDQATPGRRATASAIPGRGSEKVHFWTQSEV